MRVVFFYIRAARCPSLVLPFAPSNPGLNMDNLRCNRLTCRKALSDKAVVTTCSHIFCVDCANELFNASRLCPACETSLTEPDDVVVSSLHPSNDYKTSVLSGLNPTIVLEICSRALSFWQYQMHQEYSFQQALYRNVTEKTAQLEKRLENVIREANGEISLLTNKMSGLERDLEGERRKTATLQDSLKESEKEYHKLKAQYDKLKRKALLGGTVGSKDGTLPPVNQSLNIADRQEDSTRLKQGMAFASGAGIGGPVGVDVGAVVGNMEAAGIQRTPIGNRTMAGGPIGMQSGSAWRQPQPPHARGRPTAQRQPFSAMEGSFRTSVSTTRSDHSDSTAEVEALLAQTGRHPARNVHPVHGNAYNGQAPSRVSTAQGAPHSRGQQAVFHQELEVSETCLT
ncbi:hypothetical protein L226DRAFT_75340 [Lentinus tigrinus ALCF2SS1-7]|uniref:uncharacterized protein n=1 Tax=Lentinus tigrinus ALCF2SS1-7 TaxID=1328758 RepID=UPI001165CC15|nr:hypothetical protein L226DRAFT_75340 [Lentinus tigrinus ALCF2SS1-7]